MKKIIKRLKENLPWIFNRNSLITQQRCDAAIESGIWLLRSIKKEMQSLNKTVDDISGDELMDIVHSNVNKLIEGAQMISLEERKKK